jgi:putative ABC transport system permease protein
VSGLASGGLLAVVLTWVINKAFFGWTIDLSYPAIPLATMPL